MTRSRLSDLEIVLVDLGASRALLESEEASTLRLSASDRLRVDRLSGDPARQSLWRAARVATRIVLERAIGPRVRGADFEIASGGRPSLSEGFPHFNVSHTADVALIAVCRSSLVGVDIESHRALSISPERRRRIVAAAARFTGDEANPDNDVDVLVAWVRLEAVAKARGAGIGVLLTEQGVIGSAGEKREKSAKSSPAVTDLDVGTSYVGAVAADALPEKIAVRRFPKHTDELAEFLSEFST
ncbi:4'-phosphopantetheinyl transferase family protein [Hyphomicrobium denitrificans]|uniref:4'-phosphopantetheinyl transferase family protein n=1 Tax=Hyphomicrobium denitrificans TaxID=53399 RepID=UPI001FCA5540|nr:phosphopantetheinyl transferase [Hyphomicrobium denitrificans]